MSDPTIDTIRRAALLRHLLAPAYRTVLRLEIEGVERIPERGACILAFNHLSNLDPHLLFTLVRRPDATGLVAAEYRARAVHRWLVEAGGGMWLRRKEGDRMALRRALELLAGGWLVGLAPEGGRSIPPGLRPGRPGVGFLALRSGAPVLPVAVWGTERVVSGMARLRRVPVGIRIGEPRVHPRGDGESFRQASRTVTDEVMRRIAALLPCAYRGVYAGGVP